MWHWALRHRLLNITQVSSYLRPLIEARLGKSVSVSSITMSLSRLQRSTRVVRKKEPEDQFSLGSLLVTSDLALLCYSNAPQVAREVHQAFGIIQKRGRFCIMTHGVNQVTIMTDRREVKSLMARVSEKPLWKDVTISAIGVSFRREYASSPGFLATVFQVLYLQGINIVEIASTSTELLLFLRDGDVRLAFDSLYNHFVAQRKV